jgi:hypothetical protein
MMHRALQCREPGWSTIWDTDSVQAALSRRHFLGQVADTGTFLLPIHFSQPHHRSDRSGRRALPLYLRSIGSAGITVAHEMLERLPLGKGHIRSFELIPIGPLNPLRFLQGMQPKP